MSAGATDNSQRERPAMASLRTLADQAFSRAAGAPLIEGNDVRLLKDASQNYPAWLDSIRAAKHHIHFESYIIHEDTMGQEFADALTAEPEKVCLSDSFTIGWVVWATRRDVSGIVCARVASTCVVTTRHASIVHSAGYRAITARCWPWMEILVSLRDYVLDGCGSVSQKKE